MRMAIGCDHVGFPLKATVMGGLEDDDHAVLDLGTHSTDPVDYPSLVRAVATAIGNGFVDGGILLCANGMGGAIAANKLKTIRAAACAEVLSARRAREELDVNLLCLDAADLDAETAAAIAREWASAEFARTDTSTRTLGRIAEMEGGVRPPDRAPDVKAKPSRPAAPRRTANAPATAARTVAPAPVREPRPEPETRRTAAADAAAVEAFLASVKDDNVKAMTARIFEFMRGRFPRAAGSPHADGFSFHVGNEHAASVTVGKGFVQLEAGPDRIPTSRIRDVDGLEVALALPSIVRAMASIKA